MVFNEGPRMINKGIRYFIKSRKLNHNIFKSSPFKNEKPIYIHFVVQYRCKLCAAHTSTTILLAHVRNYVAHLFYYNNS